jgi:hypothetical protein
MCVSTPASTPAKQYLPSAPAQHGARNDQRQLVTARAMINASSAQHNAHND